MKKENIESISVKEGLKKKLKFTEFNDSEKTMVDEVFYAQSYFPRISKGQNFNIGESDTVIDIGANVGIFTVNAANVANKGHVYSFEPVQENFEKLKHHLKLNDQENVIAEKVGVSDKKKKAKLYMLSNNSGGHSQYLEKSKLLHEKVVSSRTMDCISLKNIFDKYKISKCNFLKIDCEGEEYKILKALPKSYYKRIDKISLEVHPPVDAMKLGKLLMANNFKVTINFGRILCLMFAINKDCLAGRK